MKVYDAYRLAIETGMEHDFRPKKDLQRILDDAKAEYESMREKDRWRFDQERLWNPYSDSRFCSGIEQAKETEAENIVWGIDVDTPQILEADRLREKGMRIDAVASHHPRGMSRNIFPEVIRWQTDLFASYGVPVNVSEALAEERVRDVMNGVMGSNFNAAPEAAKRFGFPMFNVHMPADNMVQEYNSRLMKEGNPDTVGDIIDILLKEPEYQMAARLNDPPRPVVGSPRSRCGKVAVKMNGGTAAHDKIYPELVKAGIGTIICMHMPESSIKACRECHLNVVISGHMSSDSLGVNLICDELERKGVNVEGISGFWRISRNRDMKPDMRHMDV